jgi:hypothetical protein
MTGTPTPMGGTDMDPSVPARLTDQRRYCPHCDRTTDHWQEGNLSGCQECELVTRQTQVDITFDCPCGNAIVHEPYCRAR